MMSKTYKLSFIIGGYTFITLLLFSGLMLSWTYSTTYAALQREINQSFTQRQRSAHSFLTEEVHFLENFGKSVAKSENIITGLSQGDGEFIKKNLNQFKDENIKNPDILFVTDYIQSRMINSSAPIYRIEESYESITSETPKLIISGEFLNIHEFETPSLLLIKAEEVINPKTGKIEGFVYCGTFLENNYSVLRNLREKTTSEIALISHQGRIVATTDKRNSHLTQSIHMSSLKQSSSQFIDLSVEESEYMISTSPISFGTKEPILITLGVKNTPFQELNRDFLRKSVIFFLLSLLIIGIYSIMFRLLSARPLKKLMEYSNRVEAGNLKVQFEQTRITEFNLLGMRLQDLVNTIKSREEQLKQFAEATFEAIIIQKDGMLLEANDQFYTMFGFERKEDTILFNNPDFLSLLYQNESLEEVMRHIMQDLPTPFEAKGTRNDGTSFPVEIRIRHITNDNETFKIAALRDLTERHRMAALMIQTEKMMSVGGLAAGMAHEINNPLAGMIQTANVMQKRIEADNTANLNAAENANTNMSSIRKFMLTRGIPAMLTDIQESGQRVAGIVKNMLEFSRSENITKSSHSLEEILDHALEIASTDYNLTRHYDFKSITIWKEYDANLPLVLCDAGSIQQVYLNILRNGSEAMHEADTVLPQFTLRLKLLSHKQMVSLEIEDNGPGIDEMKKKRIFEPFFTLKEVGKGTGLGLSVSYFIVKENHHGEITVESEVDRGTKFIINLPI